MKLPLLLTVASCWVALTVVPFTAVAQQAAHSPVVLRPSDSAWQPAPPALPPGAESALLAGNPSESGQFTIRVRLPVNYRVPPHWHSVNEYVTLLSGTLCIGTGERTDFQHSTYVGAGTFFMMPANLAHSLWTQGPVEYELHAVGPFDGTM